MQVLDVLLVRQDIPADVAQFLGKVSSAHRLFVHFVCFLLHCEGLFLAAEDKGYSSFSCKMSAKHVVTL